MAMEHWRFYVQGWLLEWINRRDAAIAAYRAALRLKPDFHRATNRLAYLLASLGRYAEAEPHFKTVLLDDPGNAVAHFNLGFTYDQTGRFGDAIAAFSAATRLNPKIDRAWYGMGLAHARLGQHEEAAAALHEAATLQPMNPHAWYQLGMAYHTIHRPEKVQEVVMHLLRFDPKMTRRLILDAERTDLAHLVKDLMV
jgi:tetratricopeptide (TPR) repeat protein